MPILTGAARPENPEAGQTGDRGNRPSNGNGKSNFGGGLKIGDWLPVCSNSDCDSSWLRLWRARQTPVFEGGWLCGARCTVARIQAAVLRELKGLDESVGSHSHRIPLGLLLLSQGIINPAQLRSALASQKRSGGRIGMCLQQQRAVGEDAVTRALGAQWGCPVLQLDGHSPHYMTAFAPRLLVDALGFLPLRRAGSSLLYIGFEDRVDRCVGFAIERMNNLRVEAGIVNGSEFAEAHRRMIAASFPPARLVEATGVDALVAAFSRIVEESQPVDARIVRLHEYFWLRLWKKRQPGIEDSAGVEKASVSAASSGYIEDVLCSLVDSRR